MTDTVALDLTKQISEVLMAIDKEIQTDNSNIFGTEIRQCFVSSFQIARGVRKLDVHVVGNNTAHGPPAQELSRIAVDRSIISQRGMRLNYISCIL